MEGKLTTYRQTDTLGKSQLDLIIMVFDGAISAFNNAKLAIQSEETSKARDQLERARRFVVHLYTTLNIDKGGEIAESLGKLYTFIINQTNVIEATKDLGMIDDNITVLENVRQGWTDLKAQGAESQHISHQGKPRATTGSFSTSA